MKRIVMTAIFLIAAGAVVMAQKYAYVDQEYIFGNIPAYVQAQDRLEAWTEQYQAELAEKRKSIEQMYAAYQSEASRISADVRRQREDAIIQAEKDYKEQQRQYFGPEGEMFQKEQKLLQPIRERVQQAVENLAVSGGYAVIFDKAAGLSMIYANPQYDLSNLVLEKLGYKK
ncbi:MAG: OmpH family outer membrane protein [Mangrovibacterium sp.]